MTRAKRWTAVAIKAIVVLVVAWFIRRTIADALDQLAKNSLHLRPMWLVASGGFYLLGALCCGLFWHCTLRALGQPVRIFTSLRAYFVGHLGKYVPGKAMVVVLRTGLVSGQGVSAPLAAASVFFETLTQMASGACFSAAVAAFCFRDRPWLPMVAVAVMLLAGVPTLPPIFRRVVGWIHARAQGAEGQKTSREQLAGIGYRLVLLGWVATLAGWVFWGASLWAVLKALGAPDCCWMGQWYIYVGAVALATVVGFLSFLPGGAGVREAALAESLRIAAPYLGGGLALVAAILLRLVWLMAELLISGILYVARRRSPSLP